MQKDTCQEQIFNNYIQQIDNYFRKNETKTNNFQIGLEVEHFLVKKSDLTSVTFPEEKGIADIFELLTEKGWQVCEWADDRILCLAKGEDELNLEPGGQVEFSFGPKNSIAGIKEAYIKIYRDLLPILDEFDYTLLHLGYHPKSKISDLPLLPKSRYSQMYHHFKSRGKYAHHMMKGTASTQISIDYINEKDFHKKFKVANWLSPILYALLDNSPIFEGEIANNWVLRYQIWSRCDDDRCGIIKDTFEYKNYSYQDYARYILNLPAIYDPQKPDKYLGEMTFADLFKQKNKEELSQEDLEHILSFAFNDVRAKKYLEIRMADSIPYPLFFGYLALIKGIFYKKENLNYYCNIIEDLNPEDICRCFSSLPEKGVETNYYRNLTIRDWGQDIIARAKSGLQNPENIVRLEQLEDYLTDNLPIRKNFSGKDINYNNLIYADIKPNLGSDFNC